MEDKKGNLTKIILIIIVIILIFLGFKFIPQIKSLSSTNKDSTSHTIILTQDGFEPSEISITKGDTVIFQNNSGNQASVNSAEYPDHQLHPFLNLGILEIGQTLQTPFVEAGSFRYVNHLNPENTGVVVVTE